MIAVDAQAETRCSDVDREAVAAELRRHAVAGRLDAAELDERIGRALRARTRRELAATLEQLPAARSGPPATIPPATATVVVIVVLAVALWLTGHLGTDAMLWAVAAFVLYMIWRRPRRAS